MAKTVIIDGLHVTFRIPDGLPDNDVGVIRQTLAGDEFTNRLRRVTRAVIRSLPELAAVRVSLTR